MRVVGRSTLVATLLLAAAPGAAHGADPVPGGRYVQRSDEDGARVRILLTLANDGREFVRPSYASIDIGCDAWSPYLASWYGRPDAAQVSSGGHFRRGPVRGRFVRNGRLAVGTATFAGSRRCPARIVRFRARLTGTPNASRPGVPSPCDFVTIRYSRRKRSTDGYRLAEQGLGCSRARRIARRLSASPGCAALTAPGHACTVGGVRCEVIAGGAWRRLAGRRCAIPDDPARATELVHQQPCLPPDAAGDFIVWVINLDCRTARAFPFNDQVDCPVEHDFRPHPCASHAGFTCTVRYIAVGAGDGEEGRCVEDRTGYRAFEYFQDYGL